MEDRVVVRLDEWFAGAGSPELDEKGHLRAPLVVLELDGEDFAACGRVIPLLQPGGPIVVGHSTGPLPDASADLIESLTLTLAPAGPGRSWVKGGHRELDAIARTVAHAPQAALTLAALVSGAARTSVVDGLMLESLAYSMLLGSSEFGAWRAATPRQDRPKVPQPVLLSRSGAVLQVSLNQPERHNAFSSSLRDGLVDALWLAELDDSITEVVLSGEGRSFCSGGDLDEFGSARDPAVAHGVRLNRSAGWAVHRIEHRVRAHLHGACIGAGIEVPAFASRVEARPGTWFQLPELSMGLVPGAGGTVSLTRRIGRWRTAFAALSGQRLDLDTAVAWGLVDSVV